MVTSLTSNSMSKKDVADRYWHEMGLAAPARRALIGAGIYTNADLKSWSLKDISELHGIGKNALEVLKPWVGSK